LDKTRRFHLAGTLLRDLPIPQTERLSNSLSRYAPVNPYRTTALQIIPTFMLVGAFLRMTTPEDEH
jgi:hypothetical protein